MQDQKAKKRRRQEGTQAGHHQYYGVACSKTAACMIHLAEKLSSTQKAISKWEAIRRHDTDPKQKAALVAEVMKEVLLPALSPSCFSFPQAPLHACVKC